MNQLKRNYIQQIKHGVTTIRDMGALPNLLHDHIKQIEKGELIGPRVVYCNSFTNIYGGHPDVDPAAINIFDFRLQWLLPVVRIYGLKTQMIWKKRCRINSSFGASLSSSPWTKVSAVR